MSIYGDKAYALLEKLSFPRTSGSGEEHRAAQMIMDEIKSFGLEPRLEPFEVKWNEPTMATFSVTAPVQKEFTVTGLINAIYDAALEAKDHRTVQFLDWFVKEQGEEEVNSSGMIRKMELFGGDAKALYMLNSELAGRTYSAPSLKL